MSKRSRIEDLENIVECRADLFLSRRNEEEGSCPASDGKENKKEIAKGCINFIIGCFSVVGGIGSLFLSLHFCSTKYATLVVEIISIFFIPIFFILGLFLIHFGFFLVSPPLYDDDEDEDEDSDGKE
ncbi:MAG: hypothetical protein IKD11_02595 [Oscillospiraceae bacterium]|nr:hypothetical protein [Oscillospiraceae bacterium]